MKNPLRSLKPLFVLPVCLWIGIFHGCTPVSPQSAPDTFTVAVVNTGQGLAQIGCAQGHAIAWDMGTDSCFTRWDSSYTALDTPTLDMIIISHSHADHYAGLSRLSPSRPFSGMLVVSPLEDTALLRAQVPVAWRDDIRFKFIHQSDTIATLPGVTITCLWPPDSVAQHFAMPLSDSLKNRYSLCFLITHGANRLLITSDIDSIATRALADTYGDLLHNDITMVPHHGSATPFDPIFYGYCAPAVAIISCSYDNSYGHPAPRIIDLLFQMNVTDLRTYRAGTILFESNGEYWNY